MMNTRLKTLLDNVKQTINEIDADTVKQKCDQQTETVLIDVRELAEWQAGHLPRAIHLSRGLLELKIEGLVPDENTEIIVYCGGGLRSALAAESLQRMGYKRVYSMDNGYAGWVSAGYSISE
ncbi:MAG: rhodanese-like domain-containing protein [Gammaproteobacteria bacterium]